MFKEQEFESLIELAGWSYYKDLPDDHTFDLNEAEDWKAFKKYASHSIFEYINKYIVKYSSRKEISKIEIESVSLNSFHDMKTYRLKQMAQEIGIKILENDHYKKISGENRARDSIILMLSLEILLGE